jgi:hypothetical protein
MANFGVHHVLVALTMGYGLYQQPSEFWTNELVRTAAVLLVWDLIGQMIGYWRVRRAGEAGFVPPPVSLGPHHVLLLGIVIYAAAEWQAALWKSELLRTAAMLVIWEIATAAYALWRQHKVK